MADVLSIIIFLIFAYIVSKKYIIPRIVAKRAAKRGETFAPAETESTGIADLQELQGMLNGRRPVTCMDVRWVDLAATDEILEQDLRYKANEMLLNASTRGRDVQLNVVNMGVNLLLYVTYTV